ncbi:MAG: hypothetical protein WDO15_14800 [Bacteroidota bacterium]
MEIGWNYQQKKGNAGLGGRPPRLKDLGEHSIETFVRELIQNSLDAKLEASKPVEIVIKLEEWKRSQIQGFFEIIGKKHLDLFSESHRQAITEVKPKMADGIKLIEGKKTKTFSLTIEEHNCIGLTGSVKGAEGKSNFSSLMRKTDDNEAKKELSNSGGTWGKGSSIFAYSSDLWMWFCYTALSEPNSEDDGQQQTTRFIGRGMLSPYYSKTDDIGYFGDCWFCKKNTDAFPLLNDDADLFAEVIGLSKRVRQPGTTFFIPFFNTFLENPTSESATHEFYSQVLRNWFVPIYNNELIVTIFEGEKEHYRLNRDFLGNVEQLKFKLEILKWYNENCPPSEKFIKETYELEVPALKEDYRTTKNQFSWEKEKVKADLVIRVIDPEEDIADDWGTMNKVMLTRNRGMLIDHHLPFDLTSIRTESILFGGLQSKSELNENKRRHLDLFLGYSENPAHNKWCQTNKDYNSCFLDFFEGRRPAPEWYIKKIFDEVYKSFKKLFDKEQAPETSKDICSIFKKFAHLRISGESNKLSSLFSLRTPSNTTNPTVDNDGRFIFKYLLKSTCNDGPISVTFKAYLNSWEGETDTEFDLLGVSDFKNIQLFDSAEKIISDGEKPSILLSTDEEKHIVIKTCKISGNPNFKNLDPLIKATAKLL